MIKRSLDIVFGAVALVILMPIILLACLAVYIEDRRNPLFAHSRYGRGKRIFTLFKIRTMNVPNPSDNRKIEDLQRDRRITKVGRMLRAFHLDELPQLVNIIKGDMSFVGPRPIPCIMKPDGITNWEARSVIRPGLTGMAQLYCTKYTSLARKFHFDVLYVKKQSLWLDIKLLVITSRMVLPLAAFALWTGVILLAMLLPIAEESIPGAGLLWQADKVAHFGLFMVMGVATVWFGRGFLSHGKLLLFILFWGLLLASGTEFAQSFQPLRNMSFFDFVADMVGIGYVVLLLVIARVTRLCKIES